MSRQKKTDRELQPGKNRLAGIKTIDENLDFGDGVSVTALNKTIADGQIALDEYNQSITVSDQKQNVYEEYVNKVNNLSSRLLKGVEMRFGKDSDEYEMAGGTKQSERKRPTRQPKEVKS